MKFPEDDIPKSIFFELFMEYIGFGFSESEPVTVFFYEFDSIPFPDPVSEIVPEHSSDCCQCNRRDDMICSPKSTHQNHHVHPWYRSTDYRE